MLVTFVNTSLDTIGWIAESTMDLSSDIKHFFAQTMSQTITFWLCDIWVSFCKFFVIFLFRFVFDLKRNPWPTFPTMSHIFAIRSSLKAKGNLISPPNPESLICQPWLVPDILHQNFSTKWKENMHHLTLLQTAQMDLRWPHSWLLIPDSKDPVQTWPNLTGSACKRSG